MSGMNFNTSNQTLRQLLGNGLSYQVPRFQRDYSWNQDEWEDLWQDIQGTLTVGGEPAHYLGYLVLQTNDNKTFDVIDGQQRLTTMSLLVLAVLKGLRDLAAGGVDSDNNERRIEQLRSTYIGYLDPVSLVPRSKLSLNRNNDGYYKDYLVPLQKLPVRNLRGSEHLLRKAFEWFYRQVREKYLPLKDGVELARFIDQIADKLFFTVIVVTDELNAFKVFETLNARGVRLSATDLLKNYLFSVVSRESAHHHEIDTLERRWEEMVGRLGAESFPTFLRAHWNSRRKFVREADLFKTIRSETPGKAQVFDLIRDMAEDLDIYVALSDPEDPLWTETQRSSVRELKMFGIRQPWPLLLAAHRMFDTDGAADLLRACSVISFRYNVIGGLSPSEQERVYNAVAQEVASGGLRAPEALRALAPVYVSDEEFRTAFANKTLRTTQSRNRSIVSYLLFAVEKHLSHQDLNTNSSRYSIEHVLPENPHGNWPQFNDEAADEYVYRLGNMTLLLADTNKELGNVDFATKRVTYEQSDFELTRRIASDNADWTAQSVVERQRFLARQATAIWRVSQLAT